MKEKICSICLGIAEGEDTPILAMGAYGTPKYLCSNCSSLIETVTEGREYDKIAAAMDKLSETLTEKNIDDRVTVETLTEIFDRSAKRAEEIKAGTYDFVLDEVEEETPFEEIPEELKESEEDKLLDEKEEEEAKKINKFIDWAWLGVLIGIVAFFIYKFFIEK